MNKTGKTTVCPTVKKYGKRQCVQRSVEHSIKQYVKKKTGKTPVCPTVNVTLHQSVCTKQGKH